MARNTSQFSRNNSNGGSYTPPPSGELMLRIIEIQDQKEDLPDDKKIRYNQTGEQIRENYNYVLCELASDFYKPDGTLLYPASTPENPIDVTLVVFANGENARDIKSLRNPSGSAPYTDVGDIIKVNGSFNYKDEGGIVFQARRMNTAANYDQIVQPQDIKAYAEASQEERADMPMFEKGRVISGEIVVTPLFKVEGKDGDKDKQYQNLIVIEKEKAVVLDGGLDAVADYFAGLKEDPNYHIGDVGVNLIIYKKDGDPTDLDNRDAYNISLSSNKQNDGTYVQESVEECIANIRSKPSDFMSKVESGEWLVTAMPSVKTRVPNSMLPGPKNPRGDMAKAFRNIDTETGSFIPDSVGAQTGSIFAGQFALTLVNGEKFEGKTTHFGIPLENKRGTVVEGKFPENSEVIVPEITYASSVAFNDSSLGNIASVEFVKATYDSKNPGDSISAQKAALSEANKEAAKRYGSYPGTPGKYLPDIITPATPAEYVPAIEKQLAEERTVAKNVIAEIRGSLPQNLYDNGKPSNSPTP